MKEIFFGNVVLEGWSRLTLEGQKGIVEYSTDAIEVRVPGGIVRVTGKDLNIDEIAAEDLILSGKIRSVSRITAKEKRKHGAEGAANDSDNNS